MKAWKKGAIVGAVIGLVKVSASVLFPIIGAVVGSVLFHSIFTFITTTELKLWQKGGVVGAVWGLVTSLWWFGYGWVVQENELSIFSIPNILTFPGYAAFLISSLYEKSSLYWGPTVSLYIFFIPAVIFGLIIGALIGHIYGKRR